MPDTNQAALDFLLTRRSRPAKTLITPIPTRAELDPILTAAARTPDHGKLEPWRFIVLEKPALDRLAALAKSRCIALGFEEALVEKNCLQFATANLAITVVAAPVESVKVPEMEQILSAGAVCLSMLNAALASGWGANWLSGPMSEDRDFMTEGLNLAPHEFVAGFIHIGTERITPPERPRPDLDRITTWLTE